MRIIHFSDTHLGYRAYQRTQNGINQREQDMIESFRRALASMLDYDADVVVHAGDFFDRIRPSNYTLREALDILRAFQTIRCERPFLIVAGNHECPRSADTVSPLALLRDVPGVVIAERGIVQYDYNGYHFVLVPDHPFLPDSLRESVEPSPHARGNILVAHGALQAYAPNAVRKLPERMLDTERWNYIALGDYHIYTEIKPRCYYSGAIDYCSSDIWSESHQLVKRYLVVDTENGYTVTEHLLEPARVICDLRLDAALFSCIDCLQGAIERELSVVENDWIVRLVIENVPLEWRSGLITPAVQARLHEVFHCQIVPRITLPQRVDRAVETDPARVPTLEDEWVDFAHSYFVDDTMRRELTQLGLDYLASAGNDT